MKVLVTLSCPTLCDPKDCNPPGSSVHGILQTRILEWVAIPFLKGSSKFRNRTEFSCTAGRFFTTEPPGKPTLSIKEFYFSQQKKKRERKKEEKVNRKNSYWAESWEHMDVSICFIHSNFFCSALDGLYHNFQLALLLILWIPLFPDRQSLRECFVVEISRLQGCHTTLLPWWSSPVWLRCSEPWVKWKQWSWAAWEPKGTSSSSSPEMLSNLSFWKVWLNSFWEKRASPLLDKPQRPHHSWSLAAPWVSPAPRETRAGANALMSPPCLAASPLVTAPKSSP